MRTVGSGRKAGTGNLATQKFVHLLQREGFDPALNLIRVAQGRADFFNVDDIELDLRVKAMGILLQYLLPKQKAVEITAETIQRNSVLMVPAPMSANEWHNMVEQQLKAAEAQEAAATAEEDLMRGPTQ